jgi:hypothetical protein
VTALYAVAGLSGLYLLAYAIGASWDRFRARMEPTEIKYRDWGRHCGR